MNPDDIAVINLPPRNPTDAQLRECAEEVRSAYNMLSSLVSQGYSGIIVCGSGTMHISRLTTQGELGADGL